MVRMASYAARWLAAAVFFAATAASAAQTGGKTEILYLGQSAMRVATPGGKVILIDPWITGNPKAPEQYKNLDTLGRIDLILVTHAHGDHLGDSVALANKHHAPVWGPNGMNATLAALGVLPAELLPRMNKGGTTEPFPGIKITQTHAEHSSELMHRDAQGKTEILFGGEPVGYIVELENGFRIYHMGDTALFGDMRLIAQRYQPDLVVIPIGGHYTMDPKDAAYATTEYLKSKYAIPVHYGTNPYLKGTPRQYIEALGNAATKVFDMNPGDKREF